MALDLGAGWSLSGTFMAGAVFVNGDVQQSGQSEGVGVGQGNVGAFDAAQGGGGNARGCGQFGLGQAADDAPVAGVTVGARDGDHVFDRCADDLHGAGQQVDLGCAGAGFPAVDGGGADVGGSGQVGDAQVGAGARGGECCGVESAQDAPGHARAGSAVIRRQIHRVLQNLSNPAVVARCLIVEYEGVKAPTLGEKTMNAQVTQLLMSPLAVHRLIAARVVAVSVPAVPMEVVHSASCAA